jgi:hypothetical protein
MVAAVGEPAGGVGLGDGGAGGPGGGAERVIGACSGSAERLLDLREGVLDWVEVRRVGRQVDELGASCLDGSARAVGVVGAQVVGDDDLARSEGRCEDMADVALEPGAGHAAIEPHQRADAVEGQRRDHGLVLAGVPRRCRVGALPTRGPGVRRRVAEVAPRLVKEDQVDGRDPCHLGSPGLPHGRVLLARPQRLFLRVQPSRVSARLIVAVLTRQPDTSRHQEQWSASVASARSASRSGNAAGNPAVFTATAPGTGRRARPPVSRFSRTHRSIVGTDTSNRAATSSRGRPASTAPITRSRRSSEYAFIPSA